MQKRGAHRLGQLLGTRPIAGDASIGPRHQQEENHYAKCPSCHECHHSIRNLQLPALRGLRAAATVERQYAPALGDRASWLRMDQFQGIHRRLDLGFSVGRLYRWRVRLDLQHDASFDGEQDDMMDWALLPLPRRRWLAAPVPDPLSARLDCLS